MCAFASPVVAFRLILMVDTDADGQGAAMSLRFCLLSRAVRDLSFSSWKTYHFCLRPQKVIIFVVKVIIFVVRLIIFVVKLIIFAVCFRARASWLFRLPHCAVERSNMSACPMCMEQMMISCDLLLIPLNSLIELFIWHLILAKNQVWKKLQANWSLSSWPS